MAKNRWMAAVLNLLIWGFGYLYLEKVISITGFLISDFAFGYEAYQLAKEPPSLEGGRLPRSG